MVQNEQQYICIHQCLMVVIQGLEGIGINTRLMETHTNRAYEGEIEMRRYYEEQKALVI